MRFARSTLLAIAAWGLCASPLVMKAMRADARDRPSDYDCFAGLTTDNEIFTADEKDASWSTFLRHPPEVGLDIHMMAFASAFRGRFPFSVDGFFASPKSSFTISPIAVTKSRSIWLQLRAGDVVLPAIHLLRQGSYYNGSSIPAGQLKRLLDVDGELTVTFVDDKGNELDRATIPTKTVIEAVAKLTSLQEQVVEMRKDPRKRCYDHSNDIVIG